MSTNSLVGMNLAPVNYWSTEYPFLDRMKSAGSWGVQGAPVSSLVVDQNGWPTKLPAGATSVSTIVALDPASAGTSNTYVLTYEGTATFRVPGATIVSSKPGEIVFLVTGDTPMQMVMINSIDASKPLTEMHIVRQDQMSLFKQGEIFNPAFTDKISNFDTLRYMDWGQTNIMNAASWSTRTTPDSFTWATTTSTTGVPIEVMVALANETHTNMWVNVPTLADDDYVRHMMSYVRDNLDPSLKVNVEYSNEVWNWGFPQSRYATDMANKLWGVDANGDGVVDPNNPAEAVVRGAQQYYGYRAAQVAAIANDVFGASGGSRLENVLATQTVNTGLEKFIMQGVGRANMGDVSSLFDNYAVTTYFASNLSGQNAQDRSVIVGWAKSGKAGLDAAFNELANGGTLTGWGSLPSLMAQWVYQAGVANQYGLNLVAYEGGLDLSAAGFSAADQPAVMDFFARLEADPRMADIYGRMVDDFSTAGGTLLNAYTDVQWDRPNGLFGTLKSIYDDTSPAWDALVDRQASAAATQTSSTNYVFDATQTTITYLGDEAFTAAGNALNNVITGGRGSNALNGGAGNDTLTGGRANDVLDGGTGADTMVGKGGDDIYLVDNVGDKVIETANAGNDEVRTTLGTYTLAANVEKLTFKGTGSFTGKGNDVDNVIVGGNQGNALSGGGGNDTLIGGVGADTLDGGIGADKMTGGAGNDVYLVDNAGDTVTELAAGGIDEVRASLASYTLTANVENLTYTGSGAFTGTGNDLSNVITGGSGANKLYGGAGNDTLVGGAGNDTLDGGIGADTMKGGLGNDTYVVDNLADVVTELAGQGTDEIRTTLTTYTVGANVENLTYLGAGAFVGTGNELANTITGGNNGNKLYGGDGSDWLYGGNGGDYLDGGTGADRMNGGAGNDTYIVDNAADIVTEQANGGTDGVRTALSGYALTANVENLLYTGAATGAFAGSGNALANVITGSTGGANRLYGNDGNDTLIGGTAADMLDGGSGVDRMTGGKGDDSYVVDSVSDIVVELAGEGTDTVNSSVTYTLGANVENLRLTGTANINGTGNEAANVIFGNTGSNTISAGGGNDAIYGGAGNDYLSGGNGDDSLSGDDGNDTLIAGAGNDLLSGGAGNDTLIGGPGKDALIGGPGADRFVFQSASDLSASPLTTSVILDFNRAEGDRIDFSQLASTNKVTAESKAGALTTTRPIILKGVGDLNNGTSGNLKFVGDAAFSKHAGEFRASSYGSYWNVQGDLNGDGIADISLNVSKGSGALIASDFIFA